MEPFLPKEIIWRKKVGFSAPLGRWLLDQEIDLQKSSFWNAQAHGLIEKNLAAHTQGQTDHRLFLWNTFILQEWAQSQLRAQEGSPKVVYQEKP